MTCCFSSAVQPCFIMTITGRSQMYLLRRSQMVQTKHGCSSTSKLLCGQPCAAPIIGCRAAGDEVTRLSVSIACSRRDILHQTEHVRLGSEQHEESVQCTPRH